jgi:hypothetical protein
MIEPVIEARPAKEGVDHQIVLTPNVVFHPKKQLSQEQQAFCRAYWELEELGLDRVRFTRFAKEAGAIIGQKSNVLIANLIRGLSYLDLGVKCEHCGHPIIARTRDDLYSFGAGHQVYIQPDGSPVCHHCVYGRKSDFERFFEDLPPKTAQLPEVSLVYAAGLTITEEMKQFCEAYWALDTTELGRPKLKYPNMAEVIAASMNAWVESWLGTVDSTTTLRKLCHLELVGARCRSCEVQPIIVSSRTALVKVLSTRRNNFSYVCGQCLADEAKQRRSYYYSGYWSPPVDAPAVVNAEVDPVDEIEAGLDWPAYQPTLATRPFPLVDIVEVCPGCGRVAARLHFDDDDKPSWNLYSNDDRGDRIATVPDLAERKECPGCGYRNWPPPKEKLAQQRAEYLRQAVALGKRYPFISLSHISPAALVQNPTLLLELLVQASTLARLVEQLPAEADVPARTADRLRTVNAEVKAVLKRIGWYTDYAWVEPGDVLLYLAGGMPRQATVIAVDAGAGQVTIQLPDQAEYKTVPFSALAGSPHYLLSAEDDQPDLSSVSGLLAALDKHDLPSRYSYGVFYPEDDADLQELVREFKNSRRIVEVITLPPLDIKIRPLLALFERRLPFGYLRQNASVSELLAALKKSLGAGTIVIFDGAESLHSSALPHLLGAADTLQKSVGFILFSIRDRQAWEKKLNGMRMGNKLRQYALIIDDI